MNGHIGIDFFQLAERHSEAVANLKALQARCVQGRPEEASSTLAEAVAREKDLRATVIDWKPASNIEAQLKLLYMVQYVFAMRTSLEDHEMSELMDSIAHLRKK